MGESNGRECGDGYELVYSWKRKSVISNKNVIVSHYQTNPKCRICLFYIKHSFYFFLLNYILLNLKHDKSLNNKCMKKFKQLTDFEIIDMWIIRGGRGCIRDIAKDGGRFIGYDSKFCTLMKDSIEKALVMYYQITKYRPDYIIKEFSNKTVNVYNIF